MRVCTVVALAACLSWVGPASSEGVDEHERRRPDPRTAQQVIQRNLQAIGGAERIAAVATLALTGATGSALLPPSERATVYLARPDRFKQVGAFRIILCDGTRCVHNNGDESTVLDGDVMEGMRYRLGFYHSCFSLLAWQELFDAAELVGVKEYGPARQYQVRLPGAANGRDVDVYVDAETFLIDRLVFTVHKEGAGLLQVVNQLRDWTTIEGVTMPTRIVFDTIGWETTPTHFVIDRIELNPKLDRGLFASAEIDFGTVEVEDGVVRGEIFGDMDGTLLTNIREEDLAAAGIEVKSWLDLQVGEATRLEVRYLSNIQRSAADIKPGEVYLTTYPISLYPRMMLLGWEMDLTERIPCAKGDPMAVSLRAEEPVAGGEGTS